MDRNRDKQSDSYLPAKPQNFTNFIIGREGWGEGVYDKAD